MAVPMVNFHSARVRSPGDFLDDKKAWATITIKPGIELVTAKLKKDGMSGPMTAQAYRFDIDKFTVQQSKQWLKKHKVKAILFEPSKPKKEVKEMAGEVVSELCATPGKKIRSKGKGRGLARGMGSGPIGIPFGEEIKETTMVANIAAKVTEKCWGSLFPKKKKRSGVAEQKGAVVAASNSGVYAMKGSYEDLRSKIRKALEDSQLYGKYPEILSTFPKKVFVSNDKDEYFLIDYTVQGDEVKLGVATPIEKQVKFVIKEMAERCKLALLNPLVEATWKTAYINDLPDSAFAYIESGGKKDASGKTVPRSLRHFPLKGSDGKYDSAHVINALQRLNQATLPDSVKGTIKSKIKAGYSALKMQFPEEKKEQTISPDRQALISGIAIAALKGIFEGGAGSGNWGHKGRPGHRGGSLGGGGGGGISAHVAGSAGGASRYSVSVTQMKKGQSVTVGGEHGTIMSLGHEHAKVHFPKSDEVKWVSYKELAGSGGKGKGAGGGGGIFPHVVKPGVHASTFYDKSGGLKTSDYRKLTDSQKTSVLRHGVQKYKEGYVPKAKQGSMSAQALESNKKVGALEGMRRAAINKAKSEKSGSKGERAALHVAISLQQRARGLFGQLKASGEKTVGSVKGAGGKVTGAALIAAKTAERQPGAGG
jgi:hypothetical protein